MPRRRPPLTEPAPPPIPPRWLALGALPAADGEPVAVDSFGDPAGESDAARSGAALFDLSRRAEIAVTGEGRARFLHGQCTNDVVKLAAGGALYAAFLTPKGRMIADAEILADADRHLLLTEPSLGAQLAAHLRKYAVFDRVGIEEAAPPRPRFHLAGPGAGALLESLGMAPLPASPLAFVDARASGAPVRVLRIDRLGLPGYDLSPDTGDADGLLDRCVAAGARPAGAAAFRILRIEAGIPRFGEDMDAETLPDEANLASRAISYTKGCYTGQETVARIRTYGHVNRRIVGLRADTDLPAGTLLLREAGDGKPAGRVTSSARSPRFDGTIALGLVPRDLAEAGSRLATADGSLAEVVALPFVAGEAS